MFQEAPEILWLTEVHEATQRAVRVGGCRVDEDASLRTFAGGVGIDSLADARCVVAALQRQLTNQQMRERVEHGVPDAGVALIRVKMT